MADSVKRSINLYANDRGAAGTIKAVAKEYAILNNKVKLLDENSKEYQDGIKRLNQLGGRLTAHRKKVRGVEQSWIKSKIGVTGFIGALAAKATIGTITSVGTALFDMGAKMEASIEKANIVFGEALPKITAQAEKNARQMGLTNSEYVKYAANIGDLLIPMGYQRDEAANISSELVNLSGALAEWSNGEKSAAEVSEILSKALLGEREQLKTLGVSIKEADVKQRVATLGMDDAKGKALEQAKAMATLQLITEKTTDAQEKYETSTGGLVRSKAEIAASIRNITERLATLMLPAFDRLVSISESVVGGLESVVSIFEGVSKSADDATVSFEQQKSAVQDLDEDLIPLLDRYDELTAKSKLSDDESKDLETTIAAIAKIVPTAVTEFDQYGKALDVSTDKARKFIAAQKLLLQQRNSDAIQENTEALQAEGDELERIQSLLNQKDSDGDLFKFIRTGGVNTAAVKQIKLTADEINNLTSELSRLQTQVDTRSGAIDILNGNLPTPDETTDTDNDDPGASARAAADKQRAIDEATREKEKNEKQAARDKVAAEKKAASDKKKNDDELKRLEAHLQKVEDKLKSHQERLRLSGLEGDALAIAEIQNKYESEIKALEIHAEKNASIKLDLIEQEKALLRLRDEEIEAYHAAKSEEDKLAAEQAKLDLEFELSTEQEQELLRVEAHYQRLRELAEQHGFDTSGILEKSLEEKKAITKRYQDEKEDLKEKENLKDIQDSDRDVQNNAKVNLAKVNAYRDASNLIGLIAKDNAEVQRGIFLFQKGLAIAEVLINLQKETSATSAAYAAIPGGVAISTALNNIARVRAGISIGTIAATAVQGLRQKKEGGWHDVRGQDDGKTYRAKYIGAQGSGLLPGHPVVLASEEGPEYFVSNPDLSRPRVAHHVRMIDNIVNNRIPQYVDGGFTPDTTGASAASDDIDQAPSVDNTALITAVNQLTSILNGGIRATLDDDIIMGVMARYNEIQKAAG